ncbi:carboxypeptidase-like regulatory domain-containing protein [Sphingobacterium cellulitidis]|uniref:carboxypeptidase-like regulatory domain-containing protein n=1 Tax=Sphingobacterium cellulitidis TaxID=1768011 RepID=UPI000B9404C0|nr:hypothetical protein CHT99_16740 [Sphingobacterium cellulitidis]
MKTNFIFNKLNILIAFVFFISFSNILLAQSKQEGYQIEGAIYDKNTKQPVPNATVSIQKINSKEILEYQFTSLNGSFKIMGKTTMNDSLELQISHVNFEPLIQKLEYGKIISGQVLDSIYLKPKSNSIEEVVVDGPPIFLRKDTLIINPNAFNLKENAVMEDVLSKVPGIVLWSDGKITVNGKTVSEILVNGKPFFGGDPVVATRNIPGSSLETIKVYERVNQKIENKEIENPLIMDVTLKNNTGMFGKLSLGAGTKDRREGSASINYFNKKDQLSLYGAKNNTNKESYSVSDFLRADAYKPGLNDINSFSVPFLMSGYNEFSTLGAKHERVWKDSISSNMEFVFFEKNNKTQKSSTEKLLNSGTVEQLIEDSSDNVFNTKVYKGSFYVQNEGNINRYKFGGFYENIQNNESALNNRYILGLDGKFLSDLDKISTKDNERIAKGLTGEYYFPDKIFDYKLKISYSYLNARENNILKQSNSFSEDKNDTTQYNFQKSNTIDTDHHEGLVDLNINSLFAGKGLSNYGFFNIESKIILIKNNDDQVYVFKKFDEPNRFIRNDFLSYLDKSQSRSIMNSLSYSKSRNKRVSRGLISFGIEAKMLIQNDLVENISKNEARNFSDNYDNFLPNARIYYDKNFGGNIDRFELEYKRLIKVPEISQKVALIDTAQKDFNFGGNMNLKPENSDNYELKYSRHRIENKTSHNLVFRYNVIHKQIIDSTIVNSLGGRTLYNTNGKRAPEYYINYDFRSSFDGNIPVNIMGYLNTAIKEKSYYFNQELFSFKQESINSYLSVGFKFNDLLDFNIKGIMNSYFNSFSSSNSSLKNKFIHSSISLETGLTAFNGLHFLASYSFINDNSFSVNQSKINLLNAHLSFRTLKKENLEIKVSAYDLLGQWKGVGNYGYNNIIGQYINNNLQQYFLLSLSYYLRKF